MPPKSAPQKDERQINPPPPKDPLLTAEEFIAQHTDLIGLAPDELAGRLTERLQTQPVHYANVLDGIALLRAFTPSVEGHPEAHYTLLLRDWTIQGLVWVPAQEERTEQENNLLEYHSETRPLIRSVMAQDADKLLLVSTRTDGDYMADSADRQQFDRLHTALDLFGIELLDYLFFYPDLNVSCVWAQYGEDGLDEGVSIEAIEVHYVNGFAHSSSTGY